VSVACWSDIQAAGVGWAQCWLHGKAWSLCICYCTLQVGRGAGVMRMSPRSGRGVVAWAGAIHMCMLPSTRAREQAHY